MAATIVGAIDQETTNARRSHFREGDFLLATIIGAAAGKGGHALLKRECASRIVLWVGLSSDLIHC
jgi:hypothetical protein